MTQVSAQKTGANLGHLHLLLRTFDAYFRHNRDSLLIEL
jgi:hypothetical protein